MKKKVYTEASRVGWIVCPTCGISTLSQDEAGNTARCGRCESTLNNEMLKTLGQIAALPTAVGNRPCECGHPQMTRLPDAILHCPACGSEVAPVAIQSSSEAYLSGWSDGLFGDPQSFVDNRELSRWEDVADRLDYYRGHRAGRGLRF